MYLTYDIDKAKIQQLAAEEISHVADKTYDDQGISRYDHIILTSKDDALAERFIEDAVNNFAARCFDIFVRLTDAMGFFVPDFDATLTEAVKQEITRFISLFVVAAILGSKGIPDAKEYQERTQVAADKAVTLLKSRKI